MMGKYSIKVRKPRNKTTKVVSGISLVEVIIVLAISAIFVLIAITTSQSRGRRDFDNSMKLMVANIKQVQNDALANVGPSPACATAATPELDQPRPNSPTSLSQPCPSFRTYGTALTLAPHNLDQELYFCDNTPSQIGAPLAGKPCAADAYDFGNISAPAGTNNYYTYSVGVTLFLPLNKIISIVYSYGAIPQHQLPPGLVYTGACLDGEGGVNCTQTPPATAAYRTSPILIVFNILGQLRPNSPNNTSAINLTTNVFRQLNFVGPVGAPGSIPPSGCGPQYSDINPASTGQNYLDNACPQAYSRQKTTLYFTDLGSRYTATITIDPKNNNQIDLKL